ncbi:MAG: hypothetical protein JKY32_09335 [Rhizobiales bacterium]|nr:hypothetical protein [Hyphomicrobiales bacterium]
MQVIALSYSGIPALISKLLLIVALVMSPLAMSHANTSLGIQSDMVLGNHSLSENGEHSHADNGLKSQMSHYSFPESGGNMTHSGDQCCAANCGIAIVSLLEAEAVDVHSDDFSSRLVMSVLPGELVDPGRPPRI